MGIKKGKCSNTYPNSKGVYIMEQRKPNKQIVLISTKHSHVFNVQLNLEHQTRYIGKIDISGEGTFLTNRNEKHLFRKTNSFGVNYALLTDESIPFKWIVISYNGQKLISARSYFLKKGKAFQFTNRNFELQLFVSLDELNRKIAEQFENSIGHQESLFSYVA